MKALFSIVMYISVLLTLSAQESFEVFYIKGIVNWVEKGDTMGLQPLMKLTDGKMRVHSDSYVILFNDDDAVRIRDEGEYSIKEIRDKFRENLTSEYLAYIWKKMKERTKEDRLVEAGGVSRGDNELMFFPFPNELILQNEITFEWKQNESSNYYFHLINTK